MPPLYPQIQPPKKKKISVTNGTTFPQAPPMQTFQAAYVTIIGKTHKGLITIPCLFDSQTPAVSGGYGGWQVVSRRKKVGIVDWQGVDPFRMIIGLMLDAWAPNALPTAVQGLVEDECQNLALLAQSQRMINGRPPSITFDTKDNNNLPKPNATWVVEDLTWGNAIRNRDTGLRERQQVTLNLLELVEDTTFSSLSPALTRRTAVIGDGSLAFPKTYTVKPGDTLGSIAAHVYGKESKWHLLSNANGIRHPLNITVGQVLKVPSPTSPAAKKTTTKTATAPTTSLSPYSTGTFP